MRTFVLVLLGQLVSHLGSALTTFSLSVWSYQQTGSATSSALVLLSGSLPEILLTPFAGSLADRYDRRRILLWSSLGAAACVLALAWVLYARPTQLLFVYLAVAGASFFTTLQPPAFVASVATLVPSRHLGRANSLIMLGTAGAPILAPFLAGQLLGRIGLSGVVLLDLMSFLVAAASVAFLRFGQVASPSDARLSPRMLLADLKLGAGYILAHRGLLWLLGLNMVLNFNASLVQALITPMLLGFTTASVLGQVMSLAGFGALLGGLGMTVWGGPERRIRGVLAFSLIQALALFFSGLKPSVVLVTAAAFVFLMVHTAYAATYHALWQGKVPGDLQGRVFAARAVAGIISMPVGYASAGPLVDRVFGPLLMPGGALASSVGAVIGVGPGRGAALVMSLLGLFTVGLALVGLLQPRLRRLDDELPDMVHASPVASGDAS
jgi:MFS transporter, DHA3 family, macrolide efflux protein